MRNWEILIGYPSEALDQMRNLYSTDPLVHAHLVEFQLHHYPDLQSCLIALVLDLVKTKQTLTDRIVQLLLTQTVVYKDLSNGRQEARPEADHDNAPQTIDPRVSGHPGTRQDGPDSARVEAR